MTTPPSIMFDDKIARKGPSSTLISKPPLKLTTTTAKPKIKQDIVEPEIDIESVPVLHGSFEVTKTDADITEKKVRTSTLKPFTITNGSVRMKPKKTTIEKVRPLPKVPENLTANILKLENVTKPYQYDRVTTPKPTTTSEEVPLSTSAENEIRMSSSSTAKPTSTSVDSISTKKEIVSTPSPTVIVSSVSLQSEPPPNKHFQLSQLQGEVHAQGEILKKDSLNVFPSTIVLDDQPWLPIQPNTKPLNHTLNEAKKKVHNSVSPPELASSYGIDPNGFHVMSRNKPGSSISSVQKVTPPVYQSYNNPALMYGPHEVERLGNLHGVKPYPIPIDLIGDQFGKKKIEELVLNKGEMLAVDKGSDGTTVKTTSIPPMESRPTFGMKSSENIELNLEETTESIKKNKSSLNTDEEVTGQRVGEILLDLLKESNAKFNESDAKDTIMESRNDELDLPERKSPALKNRTETNEQDDENDHTEAFDEIATVLSSMETLSFKNIKDYIMATTKSFSLPTSTERDQTTARREKPQLDSMIKSDRISLVAPTTPATKHESALASMATTLKIVPPMSTTTPTSVVSDDIDTEPATASYVEVETVQYTPGTSWNAALFPIQSKWEYVNGSLVHQSPAPMRKVYNETLQAWIIENPTEATERLPPMDLMKNNNTEPLKNISAIFDTLASKLGINVRISSKLPPIMSHFAKKPASPEHSTPANLLAPTTAMKRITTTTTTPSVPSSSKTPETDDELPILLNQNTESYFGSSSEALGQAEVEEVDPTQYEQMLLIDRVSAALRPSSTVPSLVTLMPVKSNSGIRHSLTNDKTKGSARGFSPAQNKRRFEETSFVIRTNINVGS